MTYRTMLLDPPWAERGGGKIKRGADKHYPVDDVGGILKTIMRSGRWEPDTRCCSVWCWATSNFLGDALWLLDKLGATYVTQAVWVKAERFEDGLVRPMAPGLGQRLRMCHEPLLFARIGRVPVPEPRDRMPSVIYAPRGRHSAKPDEAFEVIERHDGPGRRLEWFARTPRDGWDAWGNEV